MKITIKFGQGDIEAQKVNEVMQKLNEYGGFVRRKDLEETIGEVVITNEEEN